jgi:thermitase
VPVAASYSPIRALLAVCLLLAASLGAAVVASRALAPDGPTSVRATAHVSGSLHQLPANRQSRHNVSAASKRQAAKKSVAATSKLPNDPLWRDSWALPKVNAVAAWKWATGRPETVIAILDTGVDAGHPDLKAALVPGYDVVNHDADPSDDHGHGTMVAGVIAARSNNGIGVASLCWHCSLMPVKVIDSKGLGGAANVAEGLVWATDHGADVINMSFTMSGADPAVEQAVAYAVGHGVVVVAAAGNDGNSNVTYPAGYPGVLSVAATDRADAAYGWSSRGSWVQLAAPGCSMTTAGGNSYGDFCGTSSAAAFVSGLAGLARSYAPALPGAAVGHALVSSAKPIGDAVSAGRVDAGALLKALGAGKVAPRRESGARP